MMREDSQTKQKLIVLIIVGLIYSMGVAYLFVTLPEEKFKDDFFLRWYPSYKLLTIDRSIYDPLNVTEIAELSHWPLTDLLHYYYPAYMLIFTAPLALIPYEAARFIWTVGGLWYLWLGTVLIAQLLKPLSLNRLTVLLALITVSMPVLQHTITSQFNTLGVLALGLTYRALYREKYLAAGLWAGGLLFKPQATMAVLIFFLLWSLLEPRRRLFWVGLGGISFILWGLAELLEPGWVVSFLKSLKYYPPILSPVEIISGDPYRVVSLTLLGLTIAATIYYRGVAAQSTVFMGLLAWSICLNALIVPMFGMLHMVLMGPLVALLLSGWNELYPAYRNWFWWGTVGFFVVGILALATPLLLQGGPTGVQISTTEWVFRLIMPILAGLATWPLILSQGLIRRDEVHEIIGNYPSI